MLYSSTSVANKQGAIIEAAIIGLQAQSARLKARIAELRGELEGRLPSDPKAATTTTGPEKHRKMSAAARRRLSESQRREMGAD